MPSRCAAAYRFPDRHRDVIGGLDDQEFQRTVESQLRARLEIHLAGRLIRGMLAHHDHGVGRQLA
jgi:hypothetical protein